MKPTSAIRGIVIKPKIRTGVSVHEGIIPTAEQGIDRMLSNTAT